MTIDAAPAAFEGREAFARALIHAMQHSAERGAAQIWWADADFAHWPLGRAELLDALGAWVRTGRRLTLLAAGYRDFAARHPRWVAWRRVWSHSVQCLAVHEELATQVPTLLLSADLAVRATDPLRLRGQLVHEAAELARCRKLIEALSQRSEDSFPVTTLGL
ncbi:MAG TPA: hypothetical protein VFR90_09725 [Methylibium sp.]|uniref:hypothetical protein n=1 Tax=Methylibium sp. TaxID=2067992 RepID=UPI002DB6D50C|nr:hypothetical protein [Methylibium sp.]HEU4459388.1 hypothetical protein [Methylibium sp.]